MKDVLTIDVTGMSLPEIRLSLHCVMRRRPPLVRVSGLPFKRVAAPTPAHWRDDCSTANDGLFLEICSSVGTAFGFSNLQDGRLIQEILPVRSDEKLQVGSGSVKLELHTEDPSLEYRADHIGFMCISNVDRVPTLVSAPNFDLLSSDVLDRLGRPNFRIRNDRLYDDAARERDLLTSVLYRDHLGHLKLIYDPVYLIYEQLSPADLDAYSALVKLVEDAARDFLLEAGEVGIIDNYQVAHGRPEYNPRYDGTDRWLERIQTSNSLVEFSHRAVIPGRLMP